ncbi:MAG: MBL fold metallo-hydrolase [Betaproteobacteria bacterium]|nr:MBL fold metallo-hydrolase [Betaproteobacteria bacterium]
MIFRQLFEPDSSTYTYLLACERTGEGVLIDPVIDAVDRDCELLRALGITLAFTLETHIHADHLTGARALKAKLGSRIAAPRMGAASCVEVGVEEGRPFRVGDIVLHPVHTPGHTAAHHAYVQDQESATRVFTGDVLLIDGCGRTDFQGGDSRALFHSVHDKLFSMADETLVYPAHDYANRQVSSIGQEKRRNARLGGGRDEEAFVTLMAGLRLPYPRRMTFAVPGNEACGQCPPDAPEEYKERCARHDQG